MPSPSLELNEQADPRLQTVRQGAQQDGGTHPAEEDRGLAGDSRPVDEAERGRPDPQHHGARNGSCLRARRTSSKRLTAASSNHSGRPSGRSASVRRTVPTALAAAAATISTSSPQATQNRQTRVTRPTDDRCSTQASYERRMRLAGIRPDLQASPQRCRLPSSSRGPVPAERSNGQQPHPQPATGRGRRRWSSSWSGRVPSGSWARPVPKKVHRSAELPARSRCSHVLDRLEQITFPPERRDVRTPAGDGRVALPT
jgi:hypothetical protein